MNFADVNFIGTGWRRSCAGLAFFGWAAMLLLASCAKVGSPTGGAADREPPKVVVYEPELASTHFAENSFEITFDEFVKLGAYRTQLMVSPPLEHDLGVRLRGKTVQVHWADTLAANTTYVFQFGESVADLNEGNVAADLVYAFSTGAALDSGLLRFSLEDAWSGEPVEGARVLLFEAGEDWMDAEVNPAFLGVSDEDGACTIGYLPPRSFSVVALLDVDADFNVGPSEAFAWLDEPLTPGFPSDSLQASLLRLDAPEAQLTSYVSGLRQDTAGMARLKLVDLGGRSVEVKFIGGAGDWHQDGDSLLLLSTGGATSARIVHGSAVDTIELFGKRKPVGAAVAEAPARNVDAQDEDALTLRLTAPIDTLIASSVHNRWVVAGDTLEQTGVKAWDRWTVQPLVAPDGAEVRMTVFPGAFGADTAVFNWATHAIEHYATLRVELDSKVGDAEKGTAGLWILLDKAGEPVRFSASEAPVFERLLPGSYGLVRVEDRNQDGRWTGVDTLRHPESVQRAVDKIEMRSDWEQTVVWE